MRRQQLCQHHCLKKAYKYECTILTIAITIIGTTVKIMLIGVTWWSTIEVIVHTTSNEPETKEIIGSGATSIRTAKRDTKRDKFRVSVTVGETRD